MREVVLWVGAGEIGKAIVRRIAAGRKVIAGDKRLENARCAAEELNNVGFDIEPTKWICPNAIPYSPQSTRQADTEL